MRRCEGINEHSKLKHYILTPIRILSKARDFYVRSMEDCVGKLDRGQVVAGHSAPLSGFPRNVGVKSSDDEHLKAQLLRMMSKKKKAEMNKRVAFDDLSERQRLVRSQDQVESYSVWLGKIGKIDEDRPCTFEEDEILNPVGSRNNYALKRNL